MVVVKEALVERDAASNPVKRRDLSISMAKANLYVLVTTLPPTVVLAAVYVWLWGIEGTDSFTDLAIVYGVGLALVAFGVVAHEAIHGLSWAYFGGKPLSAIKFGFQLKTLTPYAHCKEPMRARAYRIGAVMPGLVMGILPSLVGIATGSGWIMFFGLFFTFAAGGDALVLWLVRNVDAKVLVEDHPTNAGCYVPEPRGERG